MLSFCLIRLKKHQVALKRKCFQIKAIYTFLQLLIFDLQWVHKDNFLLNRGTQNPGYTPLSENWVLSKHASPMGKKYGYVGQQDSSVLWPGAWSKGLVD